MKNRLVRNSLIRNGIPLPIVTNERHNFYYYYESKRLFQYNLSTLKQNIAFEG